MNRLPALTQFFFCMMLCTCLWLTGCKKQDSKETPPTVADTSGFKGKIELDTRNSTS